MSNYMVVIYVCYFFPFSFQERANLWWVSRLPAQCENVASCWETPLYQWSSGRLSSRCGPPSMTHRSAASPRTPRTSPSAALWLSAPTPCWVTPPSAPGRPRESWSGCAARSGDSSSWMRCTLYQVSCYSRHLLPDVIVLC